MAQQLSFKPGEPPAQSLAPNEAYGAVRFKLELLRNGKPTSRSLFEALLNGLEGLLRKEGHYTLSVELLNDAGDVIGRRAIVSAQRRSSGWFIFNRIVKEDQSIEWFGDLAKGILVKGDTNAVRIKVRSYYSKDVKLDLQTFNLLADFVAKTRLLGAANTVLEATWKPLAQQIEGLIGSYEQADVSDIVTLSFARFEGSPNPASGVFVREYRTEPVDDTPAVKYTVRLAVATETSRARVARLVDGKIAGTVSYGDVLAAARIGDQPIDLVLSTSNNEGVKKLLADLNSTAGYTAGDIGERCDRLSDELARHFTVTDKVISYWALLNLYRRKLAANTNAGDCLPSQVKAQMTAMGLPLDDLVFAGATTVASARERQRGGRTREGDSGGEATSVVPRNETVDSLLGEPGTSKTFQVFPIGKVVD
ncbi:MAG: hypothetical protein NW205_13525 [Hyphomicrobiaceae bacterium]|nr:hypothetical protein [Hyphomicrobiaceae bacterium]